MGSFLLPIATADIIASDDFSYPDGFLWGSYGGTGWGTIWTTATNGMSVNGGQVVSNNFPFPPNFASRQFNNPGSTGELFVALDITTAATVGVSDYFFVALTLGSNNNLLAFGKLPGSNLFQVGNGGFTSNPGNIVFQPNTTYHLVGAYSANPAPGPDLVMLWVNPGATDYFNVATRTSSADVFRDDSVAFHASTLTIYTDQPGYRFDNIVISNMAGGVGLLGSAVPEPRGMGVIVAFSALIGAVVFRRRRCGGTNGLCDN
jgi:hypothetical protein